METYLPNEMELLQKVAGGDDRAFTQLLEFYSGKVFNFIRPYTPTAEIAEETVQDIFTQVWLVRDTLPGIKKFSAFLFVVARNYALNCLKKYIREKKRMVEWKKLAIDEGAIEYTEEDSSELKLGLIERAVAALPDQQQKVWLLARQKGLKHSEIATQLGLSTHTVKKYMQLAISSIVKYTEERLPMLIALSLLEKI